MIRLAIILLTVCVCWNEFYLPKNVVLRLALSAI